MRIISSAHLWVVSILILASCSVGCTEGSQRVTKDEPLRQDVVNPWDEPYSERYNTLLEIDTSKGLLGTLYFADTLILYARYSECGEFGGHQEWMKIFYAKDHAHCLVIYAPEDCESELEKLNRSGWSEALYQLDKEDQMAVLDYLTKLMQLSFRSPRYVGHVMNIYTADISEREDVPTLHRFSILCYDMSTSWTAFDELRSSITTRAIKR